MEKELHCLGCGIKLQSSDYRKPGYVPEKTLEDKVLVLCRRCFRLQNYSDSDLAESNNDDDYSLILENIAKENVFIVYVIDIFNFEASLIKNFNKYFNDKDVMVIINKKDILPNSIKEEKIIQWTKDQLKEKKITKIKDYIFTSGQSIHNMDKILELINNYRNNKDVYVIGNTNVGKSTFINSLLKNYTNKTRHLITTSYFQGTTLKAIKIPLDNQSFIYDTPGIILDNLMWSSVEPKILKYLLPLHELKPITFQLKPKQSLFIGGLSIFNFIEGNPTNFTTYFSNFLDIRRTKYEKNDVVFNSLIKNGAIKPISEKITSFDDFKTVEIEVKENEKVDLVINGFGWISFIGDNQKLSLNIPKNVDYTLRKALI